MRNIVFLGLFIVFIIFIGCVDIEEIVVPDSYNDQGKVLVYAPERVEGEDCSGQFLGMGSCPDFQNAIDDAIEKGQATYGEEYVALADIIAWYEVGNYIIYSSTSAKVSGWPARFAVSTATTRVKSVSHIMQAPVGQSVYYHSSTGIKNDFSALEYTVRVIDSNTVMWQSTLRKNISVDSK